MNRQPALYKGAGTTQIPLENKGFGETVRNSARNSPCTPFGSVLMDPKASAEALDLSDLAGVVTAWPTLPRAYRQGIVAMIRAFTQGTPAT